MMQKFYIPHTLVLLFGLMVVAVASTWVIPAGSFETTETAEGRTVVVPGTYERADDAGRLGPTALFTVVPRAFGDTQGIIFFVLIVGGALAVVRATGAIDAGLARLIDRFGNYPALLIFGGMFAFALASATIGMAEEYIPFAIILVTLCLALKLDAIVAIGILVVGYGIGYGIAVANPFTLIVAQEVAELEPTSGFGYRLALAGPFLAVGFHHVWRYARRVQADPAASLVHDQEPPAGALKQDFPPLSRRRVAVLAITGLTLVFMIIGIQQAGWFLIELGAIFLALALVVGLVGGLSADTLAQTFTKGAAELTGTALLIGFARAIGLLLEDGEILHTIVQGVATPLGVVGAEGAAAGMLVIQSVLNFFIPSGSGQALVTMPLMAPISDLVGVSRQVAVLAFQMGDGLMNMIVPTNPVLMGILGLAGIPYDRWFRFIGPLILKLLVLSALALIGAVWIGYA